jgi:oligopeptide/dipeptide ABC transporter ATP-binding protein
MSHTHTGNGVVAQHLLEVRGLSLQLPGPQKPATICTDVSFHLDAGQVLVLLGESGSGKTFLTRSLTRLSPAGCPLSISGKILYRGRNVLELTEEDLRILRKREIRYVFQEPIHALNPTARIGKQMALAAEGKGRAAWEEALTCAGIPDALSVLGLFPHQLSMGMAQRVMLSMALLASPSLLIADEPTSAVDPALRKRILTLLLDIQRSAGMAMIVVTHDLAVARAVGDRALVMLGGRIVETGQVGELLRGPLHPYTRQFTGVEAPTLSGGPLGSRTADAAADGVPGCFFAPRCPKARDLCWISAPESENAGNGREVRCHYWK